jgi:tetratricopeptide (TPR) repeat protein
MISLRRYILLVSTLALCVLVPATGRAQEDPGLRLRLAQQLEQSGEYERARVIYEALVAADPTNYVYFDGLRRVYVQLKAYDEAIALVEDRLRLQQDDPALLTSLGGLQYQAGREQTADSLWNRVLALNPMNPSLYRVVANQMIEFRMYEEAASVYRRARVATGTQDLFGEDLAVIYGALQQYAAAVKEYVMLVKRNPMQLPLAQAKIASFTTTDQARQAALTVVQDAVRDDAENPSLRMLLASIAIEARQYDVALREVRLVDGLKNAQGGELYSFAQKALQDGAYDIADQAYQDIIERYSGIPLIPYAKLGRIRTAEERLSASDTSTLLASDERLVTSRTAIPWPVRESASGWAEVIAMYERLAAEYPRSTIAAQSQFRVGIIAFEKLFDLDRALEAFRLVEGMREGGDLTVHAKLQSARIMTAQNRLEQARAAYGPLQKVALASVRDAAVFELAELDYYETRFDTAAAVFKGLGGDVRNDLANDALKYLYFIQENASSTRAALVAFARADLLVRQRKYSEALQRFKDTWRAFPVALLSDVAALRVGELELAVGQTDSAFATFRFIADTMETSILRDRALLLMAEAQERLRRDRVRALAAYEELLERFPASIYAELSRQRIRVLRGDAL